MSLNWSKPRMILPRRFFWTPKRLGREVPEGSDPSGTLFRASFMTNSFQQLTEQIVPALAMALVWAIAAEGQTAGDLFNGDVLQEIRLEINAKDWNTLKANPGSNEYYACDFVWRGLRVENIGIRQRGGSTRNRTKPGLRVDFNRYEADQEFLGLKSLSLDNMAQDASMMKERVSMELYSKLGLPAPREVHARLYVNDEYAGLYAVIEPTDKNFLKRVFGENDGYLYEYASPTNYHFEYLGADPALYSPRFFDPKTHEKDPDPAPIESMIRTMNTASDAEFPSAMAAYLDLALFMKHLAVEDFLAETDGILTGMNNFYLYRFEKKTVSQFLPKDKDLTFGGPPVNGDRVETPLLKDASKNVLIRRAMNVPQARDAYFATLGAAIQLTGNGGWLESEMTRIYNQIRDAARADSNKQCYDGRSLNTCTNDAFEAEVAAILEFSARRGDFVLQDLPDVSAERLFALGDHGGLSMTRSSNSATVSVGYAIVDPDSTSAAPDGVAIFTYRVNGVVVTETSVPASAAIERGLVYAEMNNRVKTGLAIANGGESDAAVSFSYIDADGKTAGQGRFVVAAGTQIARFLDEAPFNSASSLAATLSLESSAPVYITALRGVTNERSEFILSTLPVSPVAAGSGTAVIPHFADGGGWTTAVVLMNPTNQKLEGTVQIGGQAFSYAIPSRGLYRFQTMSLDSAIRSGSVRIIPAGAGDAPAAFGIVTFRKDGVTVSEAALTATAGAAAYRMYVEASETVQTGIAIANPSSQPIAVRIEASTLTGAAAGLAGTLTLSGNDQTAAFLGQIPGFEKMPSPFQGILRISTTGSGSVAAAGLRGRINERGDFLVAAIPSVDETANVLPIALAFPHFAEGGGFTTQFVLFSGRSNAAPSGVIHLFDQTGRPVNAWQNNR